MRRKNSVILTSMTLGYKLCACGLLVVCTRSGFRTFLGYFVMEDHNCLMVSHFCIDFPGFGVWILLLSCVHGFCLFSMCFVICVCVCVIICDSVAPWMSLALGALVPLYRLQVLCVTLCKISAYRKQTLLNPEQHLLLWKIIPSSTQILLFLDILILHCFNHNSNSNIFSRCTVLLNYTKWPVLAFPLWLNIHS